MYMTLVFACLTISALAYRPHNRYNSLPDEGYHNHHNSHGREYGYSLKINHLTSMQTKPHIIRHHNSPVSHSYVQTYDSGSGYGHHNSFPTSQHFMYHSKHPKTTTTTTSTTTTSTTTRPTTTTTRATTTTTRPTTSTTRATTTTTTTHKPHYHKHYFYFKK